MDAALQTAGPPEASSRTPAPAADEPPTRTRILAAAEEVFTRHGLDGASLRQVAAQADVPVSLVSYHFGGKAELYRAIFEARTPAIIGQRQAGLALAALERDPARRLELIVKSVLLPMLSLRAKEGTSRFGALLAREVCDPRSVERGIVQDMLDPIAKLVTEQLAIVLPGRSPASIHWIYQAMIGAMVYAMGDAGRISRLSEGRADPNDVDATVEHLLSILLDGIRPRPEEGRSAAS